MERNRFGLWIILILLEVCCATSDFHNRCNEDKTYLKKVEKSKEHWGQGIYCIANKTTYGWEEARVKFAIFDRTTGVVKDGAIFFNDSLKLPFKEGRAETEVSPGTYNVGVTSLNSLPFSIKNLEIAQHQLIEINIYVGSSLQY